MLFTWKNGASFRNWEAPFFLGVGRGHIRFFGSGYWRFRSYSGSLSKSRNAGPGESNQSAFAPPLGTSLRLGVPSLRHCSVGPPRRAIHLPSAATSASMPRCPLRNTCVRPAWLTGRRDQRPARGGLTAGLVLGETAFLLWERLARESGGSVCSDVGCAGVIASRLAPTGFLCRVQML